MLLSATVCIQPAVDQLAVTKQNGTASAAGKLQARRNWQAVLCFAGAQQGSVAIIRLSGLQAVSTAAALFRPSSKMPNRAPKTHRVYHGHVLDAAGNVVDEVRDLPRIHSLSSLQGRASCLASNCQARHWFSALAALSGDASTCFRLH